MKYTEEHEWLLAEGDLMVVGISAHAAEQLGDVVFVDMHLIHKSGDNTSSKLRFTATARHHKMLTHEFFKKMIPTQ